MTSLGRFLRCIPAWIWPGLLVAVLFGSLNGALAWAARTWPPVQEGSPEEFWDALYHLSLSPRHRLAGVYAVRDGFCVSYCQHFHGRSIFRLPIEKARRLLPLVRNWAPDEVVDLSTKERLLLACEGDIPDLVRERIFTQLMRAEREYEDPIAMELDAFENQ